MFDIRNPVLGNLLLRRMYGMVRRIPGLGSPARQLARLIFHTGTQRWIRIPRGPAKGRYLLVDPRYELGYIRGDHEPWLAEWLEAWLRPGDTLVDVGAHVGYFSVCGAGVVGHRGRVVAYEPDPANYERLLQNLSRNHLTGIVETLQIAVGDANGHSHFHRAASESAHVEGKLAPIVKGVGEFILVRVQRLDDLLADVEPRVIKIDVEGGEGGVLRGAQRILRRQRSRWIIEVHNERARQDVIEIMSEAGYRVRFVRPVHPKYPEYKQEYALAQVG